MVAESTAVVATALVATTVSTFGIACTVAVALSIAVLSVTVATSIFSVTEVTVGVSDCCNVSNDREFCCWVDCVPDTELVSVKVEDKGAREPESSA